MFNNIYSAMRSIYYLAQLSGRFFIGVLAGLFAVIEIPLFLLRNLPIFKNKIIYIFWHWSFGHSVTGIDYTSRLYFPHRITLIYIPHKRSNIYIPLCFEHNVDPFIYKGWFFPDNHTTGSVRYSIMRFAMLLLSGVTGKFQVIEHLNVYKTISLAEGKLLYSNSKANQLEPAVDWTGYIRLLHDNIGHPPQLPQKLEEKCRQEIARCYSAFFERPFIILLLREKGKGGPLDDAFRCCGPQENYAPAVKYLTENGYHVVGTGETEHKHFINIPGYFILNEVDLPPALLNLFLLMYCVLYIGQQSGPHVIPNSRRIPCLITDAMPYRLGTFCANDLILFKRIRDSVHDRVLSIPEVFRDHHDLVYGYHFQEKRMVVESNSSEEILEATKEAVALLRGELKLSQEDYVLCAAFRALPTEGMTIRYQGNRPPLYILREAKGELLQTE